MESLTTANGCVEFQRPGIFNINTRANSGEGDFGCGDMVMVFKQVDSRVKCLLKEVAAIYESNWLCYDVHRYYESILRLLTPIELKGAIDIDELSRLFRKRATMERVLLENYCTLGKFCMDHEQLAHLSVKTENKHNKTSKQKRRIIRSFKQKSTDNQNVSVFVSEENCISNPPLFRVEQVLPGLREEKKQPQDGQMLQERELQKSSSHHLLRKKAKDSPSKAQYKGSLPRKDPSSNKILSKSRNKITKRRSRGLESRLCDWVVREHERGVLLDKEQIMRKGREIGKEVNFKASEGWYFYFRTRNPRVKNIMKECLEKRKQVVRNQNWQGEPPRKQEPVKSEADGERVQKAEPEHGE